MGASNTPSAPPAPPAYSAKQGILDEAKYMPLLAQAQWNAQQQYAPQEAQLLADTYNIAAPQVAATNYKALQKVDPQSIAIRNQYAGDVGRDLALGTQL